MTELLKEKITWTNDDNNIFYESLKADSLESFAKKGGLASGCDMQALTTYWSNAQSILEVGAGYGRVLDYLIKHEYQGTITGIERCKSFFKDLQNKYKSAPNLTLINENILNIDKLLMENFDLIFMLWSGIADFTSREQKTVFSKLYRKLSNTGTLIIDTMPSSTVPLGMKNVTANTIYKLEVNGVCINTYSMSLNEINEHGYSAGFSNIRHIKYITDTGRTRLLHFLS